MPMMSSLWCRGPVSRLVTRKLFLQNLQVYRGLPDAPEDGAGSGRVADQLS
jgi:hypothetical protein